MHNTREKNKIKLNSGAGSGVFNVLFVGVGGQGIVLASDILALAALYAGHDVKKSEVHGMSQRGGSVFAHVRFGKHVFSPVIAKNGADIIVSLEEMETLRWLDYAKADTKFILVKTRILPFGAAAYPEGVENFLRKKYQNVITLDPAALAEKLGGQKFINVALIGVLSKYLGIKISEIKKAIVKCVPAGTAEKNIAAFELGESEANR